MSKLIKVFISQPMKDKTEKQIQNERDATIAHVKQLHPDAQLEFLDSFFKDFNGNPVQFIGKSILLLGEADVAVFCKGWEDARGCRIEHTVAWEYGITVVCL
jgi:hypothetical protein